MPNFPDLANFEGQNERALFLLQKKDVCKCQQILRRSVYMNNFSVTILEELIHLLQKQLLMIYVNKLLLIDVLVMTRHEKLAGMSGNGQCCECFS